MLYASGVGSWITPSRSPVEASPRSSVPFGSIQPELVTLVRDNPRVDVGLGCGDRICSPCAAKMQAEADQGTRMGMGAFVGLGELETATPFEASQECRESTDVAACSSVEWANYAMADALKVAADARSVGSIGTFEFRSTYEAKFDPHIDRLQALIADYSAYSASMPADVATEVRSVLADANNAVAHARSVGDVSVLDGVVERVRAIPPWRVVLAAVVPVSAAVSDEQIEAAGKRVVGAAKAAMGTVGDLAGGIMTTWKWIGITAAALALLYGSTFLPRGRG